MLFAIRTVPLMRGQCEASRSRRLQGSHCHLGDAFRNACGGHGWCSTAGHVFTVEHIPAVDDGPLSASAGYVDRPVFMIISMRMITRAAHIVWTSRRFAVTPV